MKKPKKRIVFLQLPLLDNDVSSKREHPTLAAIYLEKALHDSYRGRQFETIICPEKESANFDDHSLASYLLNIKPDIIAGTLYLWNIERFLRIAKMLKESDDNLQIIAGGPEIAHRHPFVFKRRILDAAVEGEGESVFPFVVKTLRNKSITKCYSNTAFRCKNTFIWGSSPHPPVHLQKALPSPESTSTKPDSNGMAYLETSRGCPMQCSFCCYSQQRKKLSFIIPHDVIRRIEILMERGAKEIRFIDPTFNSHPAFEEIIAKITSVNRSNKVAFFAEIRADTITPMQAKLLKKANFTDLEVGVQSINQSVLSIIKRNTNLDSLKNGIHNLVTNKLHLTVDIMCGLPLQTLEDIKQSINWAYSIKNADVQFLHTLLLPGTTLRTHSKELGLNAQNLPPYRVTSTSNLSEEDILKAEIYARSKSGREPDCPASRFVGAILPDLFPEKITVSIKRLPTTLPGHTNRRAIIFSENDLFAKRHIIISWINFALKNEPHILWQFVINPSNEEPLDLLDLMIKEIKKHQFTWLDCMSPDPLARMVSRRIFILLRQNKKYSKSWIKAAESLLNNTFY